MKFFPSYFHWKNYSVNRTFSLEGEETQIKGKTWIKNWGNLSPKLWGGKLRPISIPDLGE